MAKINKFFCLLSRIKGADHIQNVNRKRGLSPFFVMKGSHVIP